MTPVRVIQFGEVARVVERLCIEACYHLPEDVRTALAQAALIERSSAGADLLNKLVENARLAAECQIPLCQDTGLAIVFVEMGARLVIEPPPEDCRATVYDAIQAGIRAGYEKGYLRKSVVADPLNGRKNTGTNAPAIVHLAVAAGDRLRLHVMVKGGGCENKSRFAMLRPTADRQEVIDWVVNVVTSAGADACPPLVVGVGIGGDFELSAWLSKKALLRDLGQAHPDQFYACLERDILAAVNRSGIGPQGLGGDTTALAVLIEAAPCHIASLPVAVNIECHSHRHKTAEM